MAETLTRAVDADGNRLFGLPVPIGTGEPTFVDHVSVPQAPGAATPGASFLAAAADHVHPASGGVNYDILLMNDPSSTNVIYTASYSGNDLVTETWTNAALTLIKRVDYTYASGLVSTEVRKVYDATGSTVVAQVSFTYNYTGIGPFSVMTRDLGAFGTPSIDALLENDPVFDDITYTPTYGSGYVNDEVWSFTASGLTIKTIHYVYNMDLTLGSEIRRVYAADGTTIVGQITATYSYAGDLSSISKARNI